MCFHHGWLASHCSRGTHFESSEALGKLLVLATSTALNCFVIKGGEIVWGIRCNWCVAVPVPSPRRSQTSKSDPTTNNNKAKEGLMPLRYFRAQSARPAPSRPARLGICPRVPRKLDR